MGARHYFPANGTEGRAFEAKWCDHCLADAAFREDNDAEGCPVLAFAQAGERPVEAWVYEGSEPVCLEFEENKANPQRCRFTPDFFEREAAPAGAVADPCPDCGKQLVGAAGGGVKCSCGYWFCY